MTPQQKCEIEGLQRAVLGEVLARGLTSTAAAAQAAAAFAVRMGEELRQRPALALAWGLELLHEARVRVMGRWSVGVTFACTDGRLDEQLTEIAGQPPVTIGVAGNRRQLEFRFPTDAYAKLFLNAVAQAPELLTALLAVEGPTLAMPASEQPTEEA